MSRLILIRHGQASFLQANYDQLSEKGVTQSRILGSYLVEKEPQVDRIYLGPLNRHQQTMEEVKKAYRGAGLTWPDPILLPELDEHLATEVTQKTLPKLAETDAFIKGISQQMQTPDAKQKHLFLQAFTYICRLWSEGKIDHLTGGIQSWQDFRTTVNRGINQIQAENKKGKTVLAFTSGGTTSAAVGYALGLSNLATMELNFNIQNTAFSELLFSQAKLSLLRFNQIPHLNQKELITFV